MEMENQEKIFSIFPIAIKHLLLTDKDDCNFRLYRKKGRIERKKAKCDKGLKDLNLVFHMI